MQSSSNATSSSHLDSFSGLVVDQAKKNGFSFRNRDELTTHLKHATEIPNESLSDDTKGRSSTDKKASTDEFVA